jgi:LytR cell envelope-related transcriptional attenuator
MATYPHDGFDNIPHDVLRVGAHRAPEKKGRGWIVFAWAALATVILVVAGMYTLSAAGKSSLPFLSSSAAASPSATPSAIPTVAPKLNPTIAITVLNGTETTNLANSAADYLVTKGWTGAGQDVGARANATDQHIAKTVVYYTTATDEAAARELVKDLGTGTVLLSQAFPDPITVVLGSDYKQPAS